MRLDALGHLGSLRLPEHLLYRDEYDAENQADEFE